MLAECRSGDACRKPRTEANKDTLHSGSPRGEEGNSDLGASGREMVIEAMSTQNIGGIQ